MPPTAPPTTALVGDRAVSPGTAAKVCDVTEVAVVDVKLAVVDVKVAV